MFLIFNFIIFSLIVRFLVRKQLKLICKQMDFNKMMQSQLYRSRSKIRLNANTKLKWHSYRCNVKTSNYSAIRISQSHYL